MRMTIPWFLAVLLAAAMPGWLGASPAIPNYWDEKEQLQKPDLSAYERVRFLTTIDFPPFNFIDGNGRLAGFHVDLARALCVELGIAARCQIQALPWDELDEAMETGEGEALIAGTAITGEARRRYAFSRPYLQFPARFIARREDASVGTDVDSGFADKRVGVLAGSSHERMLRTYFPDARPVTYARQHWLYGDLRDGDIDAAFGDGMRMAFWLGGRGAENCCSFAGGPYLAPEFLGGGLAIAVLPQDDVLVDAFDFALREINVNGGFAELYLKYFPVSFY